MGGVGLAEASVGGGGGEGVAVTLQRTLHIYFKERR